jgi:hypothetical protein
MSDAMTSEHDLQYASKNFKFGLVPKVSTAWIFSLWRKFTNVIILIAGLVGTECRSELRIVSARREDLQAVDCSAVDRCQVRISITCIVRIFTMNLSPGRTT